jgi:predicted transcriptional regulator
MTINIQKCSNVTVNGVHGGRNSKSVYNITTGDFYASVLDTANTIGVSQGAVSFALNDKERRTCKGMRLCFVSKIMEHLEEINQENIKRRERDRMKDEKIADYEKLLAEKEERRKAQEELARLEAEQMELLRQQEELRQKTEAKLAEIAAAKARV